MSSLLTSAIVGTLAVYCLIGVSAICAGAAPTTRLEHVTRFLQIVLSIWDAALLTWVILR